MKENRPKVFPWIRFDEGGFVIRSTEPGGAGNMGISFEVFSDWREKQGKPGATFDDLEAMQPDEAEAIYDKEFLDELQFDALPNATDYAVLDAGVNLGPTGSIELLQEVLGGLEVDGKLGPDTMAAVAKRTADEADSTLSTVLPLAICDAWLVKKQGSSEWPEWGNGWTHRHDKVHERLTEMLGRTGV